PSATSHRPATARMACFLSSDCAIAHRSTYRLARNTKLAPCLAKASAQASPIPDEAPVITMVLLRNAPFIRYTGRNGAPQGHFIHIFQLPAKGDTPCNRTDLHTEIFQFFIEVKDGRITFHRGTESQNDFVHLPGLQALHQALNLKIR